MIRTGVIIVGLFGIAGALLRYGIGEAAKHVTTLPGPFPYGTLTCNIVGALFLGWFAGYASARTALHPYVRIGIGTGLVGAFTTFSAFSYETFELLDSGKWTIALVYVMCSLWGGLLMIRLGDRLHRIRTGTSGDDGG